MTIEAPTFGQGIVAVDPIHRLRQMAAECGSQAALALRLGVTPALISDIFNGKRGVSEAMLDKLGLRRVTIYVEK